MLNPFEEKILKSLKEPKGLPNSFFEKTRFFTEKDFFYIINNLSDFFKKANKDDILNIDIKNFQKFLNDYCDVLTTQLKKKASYDHFIDYNGYLLIKEIDMQIFANRVTEHEKLFALKKKIPLNLEKLSIVKNTLEEILKNPLHFHYKGIIFIDSKYHNQNQAFENEKKMIENQNRKEQLPETDIKKGNEAETEPNNQDIENFYKAVAQKLKI